MGLFVLLERKLGWLVKPRPFRLWFPISAFCAGLFVWIADIVYWGNFGVFLLFLFLCPAIAATLIGVAAMSWRQWRYSLPTLLVLFGLSWLVKSNGYPAHAACRWLLGSKAYKAQLFAERAPHPGELKHTDWDGWGMAGQDTEAYLVYDPGNSLASAAKHKLSGKIVGIPCGVSKVQRLEDQWYSVVLYTNDVWDWGNKEACDDGQ